MSQILDLSKRFSQEQIEEAKSTTSQYDDIVAGGYICTIVNAILHDEGDEETGKHNIELHFDVLEGKYAGYFQKLEDRAGFWGLRGYMSFKQSQLDKFLKTCTAINNSNPGFSFDPMRSGGADVDSLKGKTIGVVIQKEEYRSNSGDLREKCNAWNITEVAKIKANKFTIPKPKKLVDYDNAEFVSVDKDVPEGTPFE